MKVSNLKSFFEGRSSIDLLKKAISGEVVQYREALDHNKEVIPVSCEPDDSLTIDRDSLRKLLEEYLNKNLDEISIQYICDVLSFEQNGISLLDPKVNECTQILSEPKINFPITTNLVKHLIVWLGSNDDTEFNYVAPK